jgi:hypothetical protein
LNHDFIPLSNGSQPGFEPGNPGAIETEPVTETNSNSSPESSHSTDSISSRVSQKRKQEDMMQCFSFSDGPSVKVEPVKKKKKHLEPKRDKVALMRHIGTCKRCSRSHVEVSRCTRQ